MFSRLPDAAGDRDVVDIVVDGALVAALAGDTVVAALLATGVTPCRTTPVLGTPRAPFCMMGVCFECLVTIDDVPNRQACLVVVAPGMRIDTQRGAHGLDAAPGST